MPRRRDGSDELTQRDVVQLVNAGITAFGRLSPRGRAIVVVAIALLAAIAAVVYFETQPSYTQTADTPNLLLGNPSGASTDPASRDNYLMIKPYYVLSYDDARGTPNWVGWQVTGADLGDAPRKQVFDPDDTLPPGFKVVRSGDYTGGGFDRGHMCPHGDRAADEQMSYSTFVMTNIVPQAPHVNQKAWAQLESYCRDLVKRHNHLYIEAGPIGQGGTGRVGPRSSLAGGKVTVPAECWKIAVVVPEEGGGDDLAKITASTRVIAVDMPNDQETVGEEWDVYRTSPAAIEQKTGLHFFPKLRPDIAAALEQRVDDTPIPPPRPLGHGRNVALGPALPANQ